MSARVLDVIIDHRPSTVPGISHISRYSPANVSHPSSWNLRIDAQIATMMALTKENQTVHAPWLEKVLRAIDTPNIPDPEHRTSTCNVHRGQQKLWLDVAKSFNPQEKL